MLKMKDDYAMNKTAQITRQRRSAKELDFAVKKIPKEDEGVAGLSLNIIILAPFFS